MNNNKLVTQVIVAISAGVLFLLGLVAGNSDYTTPLRVYSFAVPAATFLLIAYNRYLWRLPMVRRVTKKPSISGTWRGVLKSNYVRPDGSKVDPIPTILYITQNDTNLTITLFTGESSSVSDLAKLEREHDGRWRLRWFYENTPSADIRPRSDRHSGVAELYLVFPNGEEMTGEYFTDRNTAGTFIFNEWSKKANGSAKAAHEADDFTTPDPFVS